MNGTGFARRFWVVAALVLVVAAAALFAIALHVPNPGISPLLAQRKPDVEHGKYVAVLGDCAACHTAAGGQPFAGGGFVSRRQSVRSAPTCCNVSPPIVSA